MGLTRLIAGSSLVASLAAAAACAPPPAAPGLAPVPGRASLAGPGGMARSGSTLYVVDTGGKAVRRLDLSSGRLSTVATSEPLQNPFDVSAEPDGGLALVDGSRLVRLSPDGRLDVLATSEEIDRATGRAGILTSVAAGPSAVFAAGHDRVVRIDRVSRAISGVARSDGDEEFTDIAVDHHDRLYIAEAGTYAGNHRIRRVDAVTGAITTLVGPATPVASPVPGLRSRVKGPHNLALDDRGDLIFCDATRVLRLGRVSGAVHVLSTRRSAEGPWASLAVSADGALIVSDYVANRIRRIDVPSGRIRAIAGRGGPMPVIGHGSGGAYPDPADEVCAEGQTDARLRVSVADEANAALPGAVVRLVPEREGSPLTTIASGDGVATLVAPSGDYVVLATMPGFQPRTAALRLSAGCTGTIALKLPLGAMADEYD